MEFGVDGKIAKGKFGLKVVWLDEDGSWNGGILIFFFIFFFVFWVDSIGPALNRVWSKP